MKFKTKVAYAAVLATLGAAGAANAMNLSEDGTGQVLIYPYYTVQGGYETQISVVNTQNTAKAVKVRFIEGKASTEVLDFNLFLSPYDVWTGAVQAVSTTGAQLVTPDKSCTAPAIPAAGVPFRNYEYTAQTSNNYVDTQGAGLDRTREGYVEIIEMANLTGTTAWNITHVAGVPRNCAYVQSASFAPGADLLAPAGGLFGNASVIDVTSGTDFTIEPTALAGYATAQQYSVPGSLSPSLNSSITTSNVIYNLTSRTDVWTTGAEAVSAVLQHSAVMNEFVVDTNIGAGTDWVVTFPTKRFHVAGSLRVAAAYNDASVIRPFTKAPYHGQTYPYTGTGWSACEPISMNVYSQEEQTRGSAIDFSPAPVGAATTLCKEVNVITFSNSNVLGSLNLLNNVNVDYVAGWMNLAFPTQSMAATNTFAGLPAIGFAAQRYINNNVAGKVASYGAGGAHKYQRLITP